MNSKPTVDPTRGYSRGSYKNPHRMRIPMRKLNAPIHLTGASCAIGKNVRTTDNMDAATCFFCRPHVRKGDGVKHIHTHTHTHTHTTTTIHVHQ